ncbi:MAG: CARDB domain-containing protein, partial [Candidatus Thermoplasmatota archaeon]|nr:CARDB domain-containing protein [Candidatus Thermoplasmatota archaeon]
VQSFSMRQTTQNSLNVIVRDNGRLVIEGSTFTSNFALNIQLYDQATVEITSSIFQANINTVVNAGSNVVMSSHQSRLMGFISTSDPTCSYLFEFVNTTLDRSLSLGGIGHADLTDVAVPSLSITAGSGATATTYFWLTVLVHDGNDYPLPGATVAVYSSPLMIPGPTATTAGDGKAVFRVRSNEYFAGGKLFVGNYFVDGTFMGHPSTSASPAVEKNEQVTIKVANALPNLDPIITVQFSELAREETAWINVSGIRNVGIVTAYDVILRIEDMNYSIGPNQPVVPWSFDVNLGDLAPGAPPVYYNFTWEASYSLGMHMIWARLDPDGLINEPQTDNNDAYALINVTSFPDMAVTSLTVTGNLAGANVTRARTATITAGIENRGDLPTGEFNVSFFYEDNIGGMVRIGNRTISNLPALSPVHNIQLSFVVPATLSIGTHRIRAVIDEAGLIQELREDNNARDALLYVNTRANLYISQIQFPNAIDRDGHLIAYDNTTVEIRVTMVNEGSTPATGVRLELYEGDPADAVLVGFRTNLGVAPGDSVTSIFTWTRTLPQETITRDFQFTAWVNRDQSVPEEDYTDNSLESAVLTLRDHRPDFTIPDVLVFTRDWVLIGASGGNVSTNLTEGRTAYANITVLNQGVSMATTIVELRLENASGTVLKASQTIFPGIDGTETARIEFTSPAYGWHNLTFVVDPYN